MTKKTANKAIKIPINNVKTKVGSVSFLVFKSGRESFQLIQLLQLGFEKCSLQLENFIFVKIEIRVYVFLSWFSLVMKANLVFIRVFYQKQIAPLTYAYVFHREPRVHGAHGHLHKTIGFFKVSLKRL